MGIGTRQEQEERREPDHTRGGHQPGPARPEHERREGNLHEVEDRERIRRAAGRGESAVKRTMSSSRSPAATVAAEKRRVRARPARLLAATPTGIATTQAGIDRPSQGHRCPRKAVDPPERPNETGAAKAERPWPCRWSRPGRSCLRDEHRLWIRSQPVLSVQWGRKWSPFLQSRESAARAGGPLAVAATYPTGFLAAGLAAPPPLVAASLAAR